MSAYAYQEGRFVSSVMEACGAARHWARMLSSLGHEVKLLAPEAVRPFVKKGKKNATQPMRQRSAQPHHGLT
jgi:transposase